MKGESVPVGTILAYAGTANGTTLNQMGWSICDGSSLSVSKYPQLFQMIGTANGGDGSTNFNLPDLRGYFLRGTDPKGSVDPDASKRTAPRSGAASGAAVGSVQGWATANARTPFAASIPHVPTDDHNAYRSSDATMLIKGSQTVNSDSGGDQETRPVNAYVQYIIKTTDVAAIPTGSVVPFAGNSASGSPNLARYFLYCSGTQLENSKYPDLFAAIQTAHGGTTSSFNLPDYRGRFLRGVSGDSNNDPDATARTAMAANGATGNAVGSVQDWATGRPKSPFSVSISVGTNRCDSSVCAGHDNSAWNSGSTSVDLTHTGGDHESRPDNISVDYYILGQADPNDGDIFPIGAIIALPGSGAPPSGQWLLCNGASMNNNKQFTALYAAIGHDNGGDDSTFNLPNYQGYFLRGCDRGQGEDPDAETRTTAVAGGQSGDNVGSAQTWATGKPKLSSILGTVEHLPSNDHHNAAALGGNHAANWGSTQTPQISGGDKETRPLNLYVNFYIKYANA